VYVLVIAFILPVTVYVPEGVNILVVHYCPSIVCCLKCH